jgi:phosphoribosylformimino-5-aminoimidazole carboxamide ribotide isomerase
MTSSHTPSGQAPQLIPLSKAPSFYAELYRESRLTGGHIIKLGPKNDEAAREALGAWRAGMQVGGGITLDNAVEWLEAGAEKVGCEVLRA